MKSRVELKTSTKRGWKYRFSAPIDFLRSSWNWKIQPKSIRVLSRLLFLQKFTYTYSRVFYSAKWWCGCGGFCIFTFSLKKHVLRKFPFRSTLMSRYTHHTRIRNQKLQLQNWYGEARISWQFLIKYIKMIAISAINLITHIHQTLQTFLFLIKFKKWGGCQHDCEINGMERTSWFL